MDRDAGKSDRSDESLQDDTGMIGSEAEEPGPGRDTSPTDPEPVAASTDRPQGTVGMSEGDPLRTRLGSHVEGTGATGHDVAAAEDTGPADRSAYADEPPPAGRSGFATEDPGAAGRSAAVMEDTGPMDRSALVEEQPGRLDRPGPQQPAVDQGVYDQEADQARRQPPSGP